jgi:hypothetical protein
MTKKIISIYEAKYIDGYKIAITFNDSKMQIVDFENFLSSAQHPQIAKYLEQDKFKNFSISHGDLEWNDYELCFPIADLYDSRV